MKRLSICDLLFQRDKGKEFLNRFVTGDKKWIYYDSSNSENAGVKAGEAQYPCVHTRLQLMRLSRALKEKWPECCERYVKVVLQHDYTRQCLTARLKTY